MFGRKVFLLLGGYIAGNIVASLYSQKKGKEIKTKIKKAQKDGKDEFSVLFENIITTQKHFFDEMYRFFTSDKSKKMFKGKLQDVKDYAQEFKTEAEVLIKEFQESGIGSGSELRDRLDTLYKNSKTRISDYFGEISPEKIQELKMKLQDTFQDVKKTIKK